jgi:hypothetical protein
MKGMNIHAPSLLLGAVGGACLGGLVGYLLHRHVSEARLEADIESVKEHYRDRLKTAAVDALGTDLPHIAIVTPLADYAGDGRVRDAAGVGSAVDPYKDLEDLEREAEEEASEELIAEMFEEIDTSNPHVISLDEFSEERETYQKLTITYYAADDVLADDREQPIRDVVGTVGPDIGDKFGQKSDDPNIVYIRNSRLEVDFEVVLDKRPYTEVVLGYGNPVQVELPIRRDE